jgi:hypothetical protein
MKSLMNAPSVSQQRVTELLVQWSHGEDAALASLRSRQREKERNSMNFFGRS